MASSSSNYHKPSFISSYKKHTTKRLNPYQDEHTASRHPINDLNSNYRSNLNAPQKVGLKKNPMACRPLDSRPVRRYIENESDLTYKKLSLLLIDICKGTLPDQIRNNILIKRVKQLYKEVDHLLKERNELRSLTDLLNVYGITSKYKDYLVDPISQDLIKIPVICFSKSGEKTIRDAHNLKLYSKAMDKEHPLEIALDVATRQDISHVKLSTPLLKEILQLLTKLEHTLKSNRSYSTIV